MKKLIFVFVFFVSFLEAKTLCYYGKYGEPFTKDTCKYYCRVFESIFKDDCIIKQLRLFDKNGFYDKIILVGFGSYDGLFKDAENWDNLNKINVYKWKNIAKINANLILIDSCYAGYVFDYKHASIIITSTGKENSWNIVDNAGLNISSLSAALRCKYDNKYNCPINCSDLDLSICQIDLILWSILNKWKQYYVNFYDWEYPSLGTCKVNGISCRSFK